MSRNWVYLFALMLLPLIRVLVLNVQCDDWLLSVHYNRLANIVAGMRNNDQFQAFIGGWVFPAFVCLVLLFWIVAEDKGVIATQFVLLPLAYIPFSIVGFTLVHAEFQVSYLYVNTLIILTFGYLYILFWVGIIALLGKMKLIE